MIREGLQQRLESLRAEFEKGQARLRELQLQQLQLHETLLRIGGAIQVLTELLEESGPDTEKDYVHESIKTEP